MKYVNTKTGKRYTMVNDKVINATNSNDGQRMVIYHDGSQVYAREYEEFHQKFKIWKVIKKTVTKRST